MDERGLQMEDEISRIQVMSTSEDEEFTRDGSIDRHGKPASRAKSGGWKCGTLLLVNQGLVILAFAGVEVNLVMFLKTVMRQTSADAADTFSKWMGTVYLFSLIGAFLSDSYLGRYLTCVIFQVVFIIGLIALSLTSQILLITPCGKTEEPCEPHKPYHIALFYTSIYLIALGNGAPEPALATFGADQFDEEDPRERKSKVLFYTYFYFALNVGSLVAETALVYLENMGLWIVGFWICTASSVVAYAFLLCGTLRYRHFKPSGNPVSRFSQVIVASVRKLSKNLPSDEVYEQKDDTNGVRKILHTNGFKFLDRAAIITPEESRLIKENKGKAPNPWHVCTVSQVEEVKCIIRLLPIWGCTVFFSVVFSQMFSLFVEQGAAMNNKLFSFHIPPASMTVLDIVGTSVFIMVYDKIIVPLYAKMSRNEPNDPTPLQRIGIGLGISMLATVIAGIVEQQRLVHKSTIDGQKASSLNIMWQAPQFVLVGISESFVYIAGMEFFASQAPDRLKSLGIALSMFSSAMGSFVESALLNVVALITSRNGEPGWVPPDLNEGHLDRFFFLTATYGALNLMLYVLCAKRYKTVSMEKRDGSNGEDIRS